VNPFKGQTYAEALAFLARRYGDREALVFGASRYSFRDVKAHADRAARRLHAVGCRPGDKVALWLPNRPEFLWLWLGASQSGLVTVMLNTRLTRTEAAYQLAQSDSRVVAVPGAGAFRDFLGDLAALSPVAGGARPGGELPCLQRVIACDAAGPEHPGVDPWERIDVSASAGAVSPATDADAPALIVYSSGTTALPKGAMLTHAVWRKAYDHGDRFRQSADDRLYLCVPLFSILANVNGVLTFWSRGSCVVLDERFDAERALATIARERCTAVYLLPLMIERLLDHGGLDGFDLSALRTGIVVSSTPGHQALAVETLGLRDLVTSYGMTETSSAVTRTWWSDPLELRTTTHGTPLPDIEVRIAAPGTDRPLPPGETGEIQVRGYNVMAGYYNKPEETRRAFTADGWFRTGDLGEMRPGGLLRYRGRRGDGYKYKGFNVSTAEVEAALRTLDGVQDAAVVGLPAGAAGKVGGAFVVAEPGRTLCAERLLDALGGQLAAFKRPAHVFLVDRLPKTAGTDKVQKYRLKEMAQAALAAPGPHQDADA
jgi:acyl-CoA synthetase (AMP-forming)/AMP-acid ligase II